MSATQLAACLRGRGEGKGWEEMAQQALPDSPAQPQQAELTGRSGSLCPYNR